MNDIPCQHSRAEYWSGDILRGETSTSSGIDYKIENKFIIDPKVRFEYAKKETTTSSVFHVLVGWKILCLRVISDILINSM